MAGSFKFAILRLAPKDVRREVLNVGIAVFHRERLEFHFSKGLDKIRAISRAVDTDDIVSLTNNMAVLYTSLIGQKDADPKTASATISNLGPLSLDDFGAFHAESSYLYQRRVTSLLQMYVDPEPASRKKTAKRSRILSDMKRTFKNERVLAKKHEDLSSHRIVSGLEIDEGLTADLVLKNGALHVTETLDASSEDISLRRVIADLGVSSLVLERAKMTFTEIDVKASLVYVATPAIERSLKPALDAAEHLNVQLVNWSSEKDRSQYMQGLVSLAVPYADVRKQAKHRAVVGGGLKFH